MHSNESACRKKVRLGLEQVGREFSILEGYSGRVALCIAGLFVGGVVKKRRFQNYNFRSSWGMELQRNLMFSPSSVVIVIWESLVVAS